MTKEEAASILKPVMPRKDVSAFDLLKQRIIYEQGRNEKTVSLIKEYVSSASAIDRSFDAIKKLHCSNDESHITEDMIRSYRQTCAKQFEFMSLMLKLNEASDKVDAERCRITTDLINTREMADALEAKEALQLATAEQRKIMIREYSTGLNKNQRSEFDFKFVV